MRKLIDPIRIAILLIVFSILMSIYLVALYKLQIIDGAAYYSQGENSRETKERVQAARGNMTATAGCWYPTRPATT